MLSTPDPEVSLRSTSGLGLANAFGVCSTQITHYPLTDLIAIGGSLFIVFAILERARKCGCFVANVTSAIPEVQELKLYLKTFCVKYARMNLQRNAFTRLDRNIGRFGLRPYISELVPFHNTREILRENRLQPSH